MVLEIALGWIAFNGLLLLAWWGLIVMARRGQGTTGHSPAKMGDDWATLEPIPGSSNAPGLTGAGSTRLTR
jgi:hypothetical protein